MTGVLRLFILSLTALLLAGSTVAPAASPLPNIVVVITDDQPALDGRLMNYLPVAKEIWVDHGLTFTDMHSSTPRCCPARATDLTGLYAHHHGVIENKAALFKPQMTLATQLHAVGYSTMLVGKYLNAYGRCSKPFCAPHIPPGWDRWAAFSDPDYYNYTLWEGQAGADATPVGFGSSPGDYSTDVIRSLTVDALRAAPANKPVFAWVTPFGPHAPTTPAPRYVGTDVCDGLARWEPPSWNEADVSDKPLYVQQARLLGKPGKHIGDCRALLAVDDLVRDLRDELKAEGRLDNTLFVFMGDNAMNGGEHRLQSKDAPYVTGIPFYMSWPGRYGTTPRTISERVQNYDFAPTLCEIAGCNLGPYPTGQAVPDGVSLLTLMDGTVSTLGRDAVLDELPQKVNGIPVWDAVATTSSSTLGLWHYIEYPTTGEKELYDVSHGPCWTWSVGSPGDPCELENRAGDPAFAATQSALAERLAELKR